MQHLIHKRHHPHLRKRAIIEIVGLLILITFAISQREVIAHAIELVSRVEAIWFIALLSAYWLILPLTAVSYKLISPKPKRVKLTPTILAHLAGSGPGRIIPGGLGNISISSLHLKKTGLSIEQAIGVVVSNNIIGLITNFILLIVLMLIHPDVRDILTNSISGNDIVLVVLISSACIVALEWLLHMRAVGKEIRKTIQIGKEILAVQFHQPKKLLLIVFIALSITLIQALMLDFSAFALDLDISIIDAIVALSLGVAIGGVLPTPGGLGGVETGIIAALVALGYDASAATSVAFLYRIATYGQPLVPGTLAYLYLRERRLV